MSSETPRRETEPVKVMATVLSCRYRPRVGRAMAFGLPASKHYLITYNFWTDGALHEAEMYAAKPIPQGSVFPVRYDPHAPKRLWGGDGAGEDGAGEGGADRARGPLLLGIGVAASVLFSLVWLLGLRGCN